jgi:hypothetical protein
MLIESDGFLGTHTFRAISFRTRSGFGPIRKVGHKVRLMK